MFDGDCDARWGSGRSWTVELTTWGGVA
jgi:hypothetical protein